MTRRAATAVLVLAALAVAAVAAVLVARTPAPAVPLPPSSLVVPTTPAVSSFPSFSVHVDQPVPADVRDPTAQKDQSKLWYAEGTWWAILVSSQRAVLTIHRLDAASQQWVDTGTVVDERTNASPDALWDGSVLVVASAGAGSGTSAAARISRFRYEASDGRYHLDPDFPVRISDRGVEGIVVARDSRGVLWAAWTQAGQVFVSHSLSDDAVWSGAAPLPWPDAKAKPDDIAAVIAYGGDRIGVVWTNQDRGGIYFASRRDGDPDTDWTPPEAALSGAGLADDHINAKATADGRILVAVKTSQNDGGNPNPDAPLVLLLERTPDGTWHQHLFGRVEDHHTRPIVVVDDRASVVYVFATSPGIGGTVYVKWSPLASIEFPSGLGLPVFAGTNGAVMADPTAAQAPVDAATGFVVLAFDRAAHRYVHAIIGGPDATASPAPSPSPLASPVGPTVYVHDTFEPWPVGTVPTNGWELRDPAEGTIVVARDPVHGRVAVLATSGSDATARACKPFAVLEGGPITVQAWVRLVARGQDDTVALAVRGAAGDAVSLRFGLGGTFSYYDGSVKVRSTVAFTVGAWYRVTATIHPARHNAAITVANAANRMVLKLRSVAWRSASAGTPEKVCFETASGSPNLGVSFDDVVVSQP
jgi:hypothetical protein